MYNYTYIDIHIYIPVTRLLTSETVLSSISRVSWTTKRMRISTHTGSVKLPVRGPAANGKWCGSSNN